MKRLSFALCSAAILLAACNNESKTPEETAAKTTDTVSTAAAEKAPDTYTKPDSATAMKNWMEYSTPGEVQKMMASWNGNWAAEMTMWEAADAAPQKASLKTNNKMIMGGRYQVANHSGEMMGMPFEGQSTMGYDNAKKVFISTWIDNMGTGISTLQGPWDASSKTVTLTGKMVDPSAGNGREHTIREVFHVIDENNQLLEMYCSGPDGKEFKNMEIKFTKKK